jgi:lipopolysaccharide/colanic/teichoic acid biosynthesis glycosyltransferase
VSAVGKRLLDVGGAAIGLIALSPLFVLIVVFVRLESEGPAFFRQARVGLRGEMFTILKFRTMHVGLRRNASSITVRGDTRITRVGAILRRTKLDELPQLMNVLLGTMSLVGPRPELPAYFARYTPEQRSVIASVKPGMTDFAALELRDEEAILAQYEDPEKAYVDVLMPRKFALYRKYIEEQSMSLDLQLIYRTVAELFRTRMGH